MAIELRLAPFPFHRSGDLFIYSRGAKKVGTELALLFYWPVPVPIYLFTGRPASPEREHGKKRFCTHFQNGVKWVKWVKWCKRVERVAGNG